MKAFWLLMAASLELNFVSSFCPEKCFCLWYMDRTLTINCSSSEQTEVPYGIDPKVKILDLSYNEIRTYNHSRYLKAVEEIDLSNNKITEAYFGGSFKFLERIDLSFNYINDLSKVDIAKLKHLKRLNLSYNSKLQKISGLKSDSLEYLNLSNCFITSVDQDFLQHVHNIRVLDMSSNSFESLNNIRSKSLEILDVSHGELQTLTHLDIFNLPDLTKLNLSFNPNLKVNFSYEKSCWHLKELDLSNSELTSLEEMFPFCSLEILNASINKIEIIEVITFFNNCDLIFVNLSKNQISDIADRSFFSTDKLKILDLSDNHIQNVQFSIHLKQLTDLDLSNNQISNISELVLLNVINLNLSRNKITEISLNFNENLPKVKRLNLSFNKIQKLYKMNSKSMTEIDLSYCKISSIDSKTFEEATKLVQINLVGNKLTLLDFRIFKDLNNLKELMLAENLWACNCGSQDFKELFEFLTVDRPLTNVQQLKCVKSNDTWRNTCSEAWQREKEWKKTVYSLTVSLAIALIVIAVIFFCKYFNDKKRAEESEREARERRENLERRLSNYQNRSPTLQNRESEGTTHRSSTPPPNYEAALLLPKLTEAQRNLAISTLSIASPSILNDETSQVVENQRQNSAENN